ncbi:MAG: hypothetical protein HQM15_02160 [Deltaproteobacteria bacterium]|nr:hypothetical protein [Deltaproteobacteria bacterium]
MANACYSCGNLLQLKEQKISRQAVCEHCDVDLHCCLNCNFYETSAYNECHEMSAERVLDKKKANFCDWFELGSQRNEKKLNEKEEALEALKSLFK